MTEYLVVDTGYFLDVALQLARAGGSVYYYVGWVEPHPRLEKYVSGDGFPELIKLRDYGGYIERADVVVFPDVGWGALADYLRRNGKAVFGASYLCQMLELDREFMHNVFTELGIGRPRTRVVRGLDELEWVFREEPGRRKYVKISSFRGNVETFSAESAEEARVLVGNANFGVYEDEMEFIVEDAIEGGVEVGADAMFNGKEFVKPYLFSPEIKDEGCFAVWVEESPLDELFFRKLEPWLANTGFRGTVSIEGILRREDGELRFYALDVTARYPFPAEGVITRSVANYADVVRAVAEGEYPEVELRSRYGVEFTVFTEEMQRWFPVKVEGWAEPYVSWRYVVRKYGQYWHVPNGVVCGAVGLGNSLEEAVENAVKVVNAIKAPYIVTGIASVEKFKEVRKRLAELIGYDIYGGERR